MPITNILRYFPPARSAGSDSESWFTNFYNPILFDAGAGDKANEQLLDYYLWLVGNPTHPVLDIGCGTGRLTLQLAKAGVRVTGLDRSDEMMRHAKQKSRALPRSTRRLISFVKEELHSYKMPNSYGIAVAMDDFLTHFLTEDELVTALSRIHLCLIEGGLFLTDLRIKDPRSFSQRRSGSGHPVVAWDVVHGVRKGMKSVSIASQSWEDYCHEARVLRSVHVFESIDSQGRVNERRYKTLRQRLHSPEEIATAGERAGFVSSKVLDQSPQGTRVLSLVAGRRSGQEEAAR